MSIKDIVTDDGKLYITGNALEKQVSSKLIAFVENEVGERYYPIYRESEESRKQLLFDDMAMDMFTHEYELPLRKGSRYSFYLDDGNGTIRQLKPSYRVGLGLGKRGGIYESFGNTILSADKALIIESVRS
jgi:hypothetical protein